MFLLKGKELNSWHDDLELFLVFTRPGVVRSQKQEDLCELKVGLVYILSSSTAMTIQKSCLKKNHNK